MTSEELASVVAEIAAAIGAADHPDRAAWLLERAEVLRGGDTEGHAKARQQLSEVVLGMDGLTDIHYGPDTERVSRLIDQIWVAVRD